MLKQFTGSSIFILIFIMNVSIKNICALKPIDDQLSNRLFALHMNKVRIPNPNEDGTFIEIDMGPPPPSAEWSPEEASTNDPLFLLYTKENQDSPIELSIHEENRPKIYEKLKSFDKSTPLKILCHGFQSSAKNPFPLNMMKTYLTQNTESVPNVILIDWSEWASDPYYPNAARSTEFIGNKTAKLIHNLLNDNLIEDLHNVHIVGHSLGAHIAGITGDALVANEQVGKVGRITGLDPAGPLFCIATDLRLDPTDAKFVDIIHTDDGDYCGSLFTSAKSLALARFGYYGILGHVDFFPNGGTQQPGCSTLSACSHSRSYYLMQESILSSIPFIGHSCSSWSDYTAGKCSGSNTVKMGEFTPKSARGIYFLKTGQTFPYAVV